MAKKLYRVREGRVLAGVCTGLARYFDFDPILVRVAWVLFAFVGGCGILAYLICALIMPSDETMMIER